MATADKDDDDDDDVDVDDDAEEEEAALPMIALGGETSGAAFEHQVAGHPGGVTAASADGRWVAKRSSPAELRFAAAAAASAAAARRFLPAFIGQAAATDGHPLLVMENVVVGFARPSIADVKLGQRLYGDGAAPEKAERMRLQARTTTSGATGLRICGIKAYNGDTQAHEVYDRSFGRVLTPESLHLGIQVLFGLRVQRPRHCATDAESPPPGVHQTLMRTTPLPPAAVHIARRVRDRLVDLHAALTQTPVRLYGASVLIAYDYPNNIDSPADLRVDVRLLDFTHSKFVDPDDGPDQGALFGLDNLIRLVNQTIHAMEHS